MIKPITVFFNFENENNNKIIKHLIDYFYYNSNLLFTISACQVEISCVNINRDDIMQGENLNVLIIDSDFIVYNYNKLLSILKLFDNDEKNIIIFLGSYKWITLKNNYFVISNDLENDLCITKIINIIALKYIQLNFPDEKVFISYAREDGIQICQKISQLLKQYEGISTFIDIYSIPLGQNVQEKILEECKISYMLYILTNSYEDRYFCNKEMYYAKTNDRLGIIYNCIKKSIPIRTPFLSNCIEVIQDKNSEELLINKLFQMIIRNKVFQENVGSVPKDIYHSINNKLDYCALAIDCDKTLLYPGAPIFDDEKSLYLKIKKDLKSLSYMEYSFKITKKLNIAISTSIPENLPHCMKIINECFFDLLIQCLVYSGCTINTALSINYVDSKLLRISYILDRYRDKYYIKNEYKYACNYYIPEEEYNKMNTYTIAQNQAYIKFIKCPTDFDRYSNCRKQMINNSNCLIIFGGKEYANQKDSGIYKEFSQALNQDKLIIIVTGLGGFSQTLECDKPNVYKISSRNIYTIIKEIIDFLNSKM